MGDISDLIMGEEYEIVGTNPGERCYIKMVYAWLNVDSRGKPDRNLFIKRIGSEEIRELSISSLEVAHQVRKVFRLDENAFEGRVLSPDDKKYDKYQRFLQDHDDWEGRL